MNLSVLFLTLTIVLLAFVNITSSAPQYESKQSTTYNQQSSGPNGSSSKTTQHTSTQGGASGSTQTKTVTTSNTSNNNFGGK